MSETNGENSNRGKKPDNPDLKDIAEPSLLDIVCIPFAENEIDDKLGQLAKQLRSKADDSIGWYARHRKRKKMAAYLWRGVAIVSASLAGLIPILLLARVLDSGGSDGVDIGQLGYLFAAIAGAFVFVDRFFGSSSGWMRYTKADLALKNAISEFEIGWVSAIISDGPANAEASAKSATERLGLLKSFASRLTAIIESETQEWAVEFKGSLAMLDQSIQKNAQPAGTGSALVTIVRPQDNEGKEVTIKIDGTVVNTTLDTVSAEPNLSVGMHEISGELLPEEGRATKARETVSIVAGGVAHITLTLQ